MQPMGDSCTASPEGIVDHNAYRGACGGRELC